MRPRQMIPERWLIASERSGSELRNIVRNLPRGCGILVIQQLSAAERRRLRYLSRQHDWTVVVEEPRSAARVHNLHELGKALRHRTPLIFVSPLFPTRSHPDWQPLPRMRAAALARLGGRRLLALGGMDSKRYARIAPLGFIGWAGISAFRT